MEELGMISLKVDGSDAGLLAFAINYIQVIQIFAEIWEQLQPKHVIGMNVLDLLLEKLDICLTRLRYSFSGFCREEECHVLVLILLGYVLRMYNVEICSSLIVNKVQTVYSCLERLSEEGQLRLSDFCKELKKSYIEQRTAEAPGPFPVHKLLQLFCLMQIPLSGGLKHIKAELLATGNNSENPFPFISGLPVGITFQIALYNISNKDMVWLQMTVGKSVQYAFLDLCLFEGSDQARTCTISFPFYATSKAASFLLRACVCMERQIEGFIDWKKVEGGPRHDVTLLSEEIDVYLVRIENR